MPADPRTAQKYAALVVTLGTLSQASKAAKPKFWEFVGKLNVAINDKDAVTIQLQMKAVAVEVGKVRERLKKLEDALAALAEIEQDGEFVVAENRKLTLIAKELNRLRTEETGNLGHGMSRLVGAKEAAAEAARDAAASERAQATLEELATKFREATLARGKVVDLHLAAARKAATDREREAFKKAMGNAEAHAKTLQDDARTFLKAHAGRLADIAKQFGKDELADPLCRSAMKSAAAIEGEAMRIELAVDNVADLAPPPIDPYKVAKALGIDKEVARVKKALDGARGDIADQLHGMARDLGLGRSGKQLVEDLRKARAL